MTALKDAIERCYVAFAGDAAPTRLDASPYKDGPGIWRALQSAPLRALSAEALRPYASSAILTVDGPAVYRHYLPRILELATADQSWMGFEPPIIATRLQYAAWEGWRSSSGTPYGRCSTLRMMPS